MKPNQSIEIQLVLGNNKPLQMENIIVEVHFFQHERHRFGFKVGRTDNHGRLNISYAEIEKIRFKNAKENLMDYNSKLDECDRGVKIVIPSESQLLDQYQNAVQSYLQSPEWAKVWPSNSRIKEKEIIAMVDGDLTYVIIETELNDRGRSTRFPIF
jgi:hypothetical protein